jgi:hypothetical protein
VFHRVGTHRGSVSASRSWGEAWWMAGRARYILGQPKPTPEPHEATSVPCAPRREGDACSKPSSVLHPRRPGGTKPRADGPFLSVALHSTPRPRPSCARVAWSSLTNPGAGRWWTRASLGLVTLVPPLIMHVTGRGPAGGGGRLELSRADRSRRRRRRLRRRCSQHVAERLPSSSSVPAGAGRPVASSLRVGLYHTTRARTIL